MKKIGALFLLCIVLFSLLPCNDEITCVDETANVSSQITHDEDSKESCSSICMCACCGQRIVIVDQVKFPIQTPAQFANHTIRNYQFHLEQLSRNIWQPPKLA
ncbi:hypothetical protein [Pedobacter helvus]|uniref:Secreted protein n=1 Tax=Pedobacter helvus TaxID=2563444 RepID=A0ABW9JE14_9SPHI|nr:hypothetical protein [Pedobacter ureilyticus]